MSNETIGEEPIRMRPKLSDQAKREVRRDSRLRRARTCYGHLAGVAGVALMDKMISLGWLEEDMLPGPSNRVAYNLSPQGLQAMAERRVEVAAAGKSTGRFAFGCLDWTERRCHLRGSLAAAILTALSSSGTVGRSAGTRTVAIERPILDWLKS